MPPGTPPQSARVCFVTDELLADSPTGGGLGAYVHRMARALTDCGHRVEIIARVGGVGGRSPGVVERDGIRIQSVTDVRGTAQKIIGALARFDRRLLLPMSHAGVETATALGRAFAERHAAAPFDLVHSASNSLSGLFIGRGGRGIRHLMRMSGARDLWAETDRDVDADNRTDYRLFAALERLTMARAGRVYAPSRYLADYLGRVHRREVAVIRPPRATDLDTGVDVELPARLPKRYLVHFGTLMRRKGTDLVAATLGQVWQRAPDFEIVWAGRQWPDGFVDGLLRTTGAGWTAAQRRRLHLLGPLTRPQLFTVLRGALAAVLPSRVDNLPNTVIESLSLQLPVIGTRGASIDELVEEGRCGTLVPMGDRDALADAMLAAWRGEASFSGRPFAAPAIFAEMEPQRAVENLLTFAWGR